MFRPDKVAVFALVALFLAAATAYAYEREDHEEDAGPSFLVILNTEDDIYGIGFGAGTWIVGTPIFGDYFVGVFQNGIEDAWYGNVGMTIRIMPHWKVAPFLGGGGSYNHSLDHSERDELQSRPSRLTYNGKPVFEDMGHSYWGGHAEAGVRFWIPPPVQLLEVYGRYTWTSLQGERDYWLVGVSTGVGF